MFQPGQDQVYAFKTANARVTPAPERCIAGEYRTRPAHLVRFGATQAIALVTLELGAVRRLDGWDMEWYEGEVLRRLRTRLFADRKFESEIRKEYRRTYKQHFDWLANTYQLDSIDLEAVLALGKRRYYEHLFAVLRSLYRDEAIAGEITAYVLRHYRFQWSV